MKKWICPNCESINSGVVLCVVCDYENPTYPLVRLKEFSLDKLSCLESEKVTIHWEVKNFTKLYLKIDKKRIEVTKLSSYSFFPKLRKETKRTVEIDLLIYDLLGNQIPVLVEARKKILVSIKSEIIHFSINTPNILRGDKVTITWEITNYKSIFLILDKDKKIDVSKTSQYFFNPRESSSIYIEIHCLGSGTILRTSSKTIKVYNPITFSFEADHLHTVEGRPILLRWETKNATNVKITSKEDLYTDLSAEGIISVCPNIDRDYKITVSNDFEVLYQHVYIRVFKIPTLNTISLPELPRLTSKLSFPPLNTKTLKKESVKTKESTRSYSFNMSCLLNLHKIVFSLTNSKDIIKKLKNNNLW